MATHNSTTRPLVVASEPYIIDDELDTRDGDACGTSYFCPDGPPDIELHIPTPSDSAYDRPTLLFLGVAFEDVGEVLAALPALVSLLSEPLARQALAEWQAQRRALGLSDAFSVPEPPRPSPAPTQHRPFNADTFFEDALLTIPAEERDAWRAMARQIAGVEA